MCALCWLFALLAFAGCEGANTNRLFTAARQGDVETARKVLSKRININATDEHLVTPLIVASAHGHVDIVRLLLEKNADTTPGRSWGAMPLALAAAGGHAAVVDLLLRHGTDPTIPDKDMVQPLLVAASKGDVEVVRLLIEAGADVNAASAEGATPLMAAAAKGRRDAAALLLDAGADVLAKARKDGMPEEFADSSLGWQTSVARYAGVAYPLIQDFDFNLKTKLIDSSLSRTAYLLAVANDQKEVVELFIERGLHRSDEAPWPLADITPLAYAAYIDSASVIEPLVRAGADPNEETWYGGNALCAAAGGVAPKAVKVLLELGVDVNAKSKNGMTALDFARRMSDSAEVIAILTEAGAK